MCSPDPLTKRNRSVHPLPLRGSNPDLLLEDMLVSEAIITTSDWLTCHLLAAHQIDGMGRTALPRTRGERLCLPCLAIDDSYASCINSMDEIIRTYLINVCFRFVDLKPPSSPSTSLPSSSSSIIDGGTASSLDSNANSIPASNSNPSDQPQGEKEEKQQRPLSSYTRYIWQIN